MDMIGKKKHGKKVFIGSCCGNSFVIMDSFNGEMSQQSKIEFSQKNIIKYGVDSALFLNKSNGPDLLMEIFEKDGSESDSCGNGAIAAAYLLNLDNGVVEMKGNVALISGDSEKQGISMNIKLSSIREVDGGKKCVLVKMGEPHLIYLVDDLKSFDLVKIGRDVQYKYPDGINVDALQKIDNSHYLIRTYERGVFAETKSCGTGSLSAYMAISHFDDKIHTMPIEFKSTGGSHWVSRDKNMLTLEALKRSCKIRKIAYFDNTLIFFDIPAYLSQWMQVIIGLPKRFLLKVGSVLIRLK
ncbi:MAG TPA: hypothetical protein VJB63_00700 [Patescibacteria group bacterium]|nr:hypothetical protein [Patescibacteria group bacterium]